MLFEHYLLALNSRNRLLQRIILDSMFIMTLMVIEKIFQSPVAQLSLKLCIKMDICFHVRRSRMVVITASIVAALFMANALSLNITIAAHMDVTLVSNLFTCLTRFKSCVLSLALLHYCIFSFIFVILNFNF